MTEYQKTYIELKKQFSATDGGPDSVRALYAFKEDLEHAEDRQAKEVLVDVYDLLVPYGTLLGFLITFGLCFTMYGHIAFVP